MARAAASLALAALVLAACIAPQPTALPLRPASPLTLPPGAKPVSFALLEDYDKGDDLAAVAVDFALMQELGIDTLRCSFGWDDYEPHPGAYDFTWLRDFVRLADEHGIRLRPYIAYTPEWAGDEGPDDDGIAWNNPPRNLAAWSDFVFVLASTLATEPNVLSYEIYNEENTAFWWDGTVEQYGAALSAAAAAIRRADPDAQVLLGGLVYPDDDWLAALIAQGRGADYDITPFHAYVETWSEMRVEEYVRGPYQEYFVPANEQLGEGEPIWINEMGYATTPGRSERDQANWFARAVSTFLADPQIEHLGFYELRDLASDDPALGDDANYYLGLVRTDGRKKLAFATVDLLTDLLDVGVLQVAGSELQVSGAEGTEVRATPDDLYKYLFVRPDGIQVLFVYTTRSAHVVDITLHRRGQRAVRYDLDGTAAPVAGFDGTTLRSVALVPGEVSIFAIEP